MQDNWEVTKCGALLLGSPVKATNLEVPSKRTCTLDDPRPAKYRNNPGYSDYVKNMATNYMYSSQADLAIRYTWDRADLKEAVHDHWYFDRPFTEYWIDTANEVKMFNQFSLYFESHRGKKGRFVWGFAQI